MSNASTLKALQTKLDTLVAKAQTLTTHKSQLDRELTSIQSEVATISKQLKHLTKSFVVSEHALLRFYERTLGLDHKATADAILSIPNLDSIYSTIGDGQYKHPSGLTLVIKDKIIVTCK